MSQSEAPLLDLPRPRILVVDDEVLICDLIKELLTSQGADVRTEVDGHKALEILEHEPFDLVLTDLKLGTDIDGMRIMMQALKYHPGIIVILMTGFPTLENAVNALKAGAYDYITKPFTIDSIRAVVQRGLDHLALERENVMLREAVNLRNISEALGSTLELKEVLKVVLQSALSEVEADFGAVLLDSKDHRRVRLGASVGNGQSVDLSPLYAEANHRRWKEESKNPILRETAELPDFPAPLWGLPHRKSAMSVPLHSKGEFVGVVFVSREESPDPFNQANLDTLSMISSQATYAIENANLYDNLHHDYLAVIRSLANAVEAKDPYTRGHGDRVVKYTREVGTVMGFDEDMLEKLKVAAILHDIGKIGIRDEVLLKPGPLTNHEFKEMRLHPIIGDRILAPIKSLEDIRIWIYQHHERVDGKGYPEGIGGSDLAVPSRTLIVAEVFDALITERAYKPAWPLQKVIKFLGENVDTHFDKDVVEATVGILHDQGESFYKNNRGTY